MSWHVLGLPDGRGGMPSPWLLHWAQRHGVKQVPQHDWQRPLRGDWMMQLEEAVLRHPRVTLVADQLACHLVAAWAAHSRLTNRVLAAWLVATPALARAEDKARLPSWFPVVRKPLPFPAWSIAAEADAPVQDWGAQILTMAGPDSDEPAWQAGWDRLQSQTQAFIETN